MAMIRHDFEGGMYVRSLIRHNLKETFVYIHGLGESCLCFEKLILDPRLSGWNHLLQDLPGYGKSPWPEHAVGLEAHAQHLGDWLGKKGIKSFILFGHSMGGVVGLIFCEKFPELVKGFINVEGNISLQDCSFSRRAAGYSLDAFTARGFETLYEWIYQEGVQDRALRNYFPSMRICDPRMHHANSTELVSLAGAGELAARMAALRIPHIYILGDPRGTGEVSRRMLDEAGVDWRVVEDAGHWPFIDQQDAFVVEMLDFVENL
jgi:pimeloyl-ACP methyl ester carboxylesterase